MVEHWSSKPYAWVRFLLPLFILYFKQFKRLIKLSPNLYHQKNKNKNNIKQLKHNNSLNNGIIKVDIKKLINQKKTPGENWPRFRLSQEHGWEKNMVWIMRQLWKHPLTSGPDFLKLLSIKYRFKNVFSKQHLSGAPVTAI